MLNWRSDRAGSKCEVVAIVHSTRTSTSRTASFKRVRARRQLHPAADLHQQIVVEIVAQAQQRVAHRRLRHVHPLRRAADAAQVEQMVERDEQVEVELVEAHGQAASAIRYICIHEINA